MTYGTASSGRCVTKVPGEGERTNTTGCTSSELDGRSSLRRRGREGKGSSRQSGSDYYVLCWGSGCYSVSIGRGHGHAESACSRIGMRGRVACPCGCVAKVPAESEWTYASGSRGSERNCESYLRSGRSKCERSCRKPSSDNNVLGRGSYGDPVSIGSSYGHTERARSGIGVAYWTTSSGRCISKVPAEGKGSDTTGCGSGELDGRSSLRRRGREGKGSSRQSGSNYHALCGRSG